MLQKQVKNSLLTPSVEKPCTSPKCNHGKINMMAGLLICSILYFSYGKYCELAEYSFEYQQQQDMALDQMGSTVELASASEDELNLRGSRSSRSSGKSGDSGPVGEFITGVILIWIALPMVWMNERRDVRFYKLIKTALRAVRPVDANNPDPDMNFKLVHATGPATTPC